MDTEIKLGSICECKVTGFIGIVTARCDYLFSTSSYRIEAKGDDQGMFKKDSWIEAGRLKVITE